MAFRHILLNVGFILMIIMLSTANFTKNDTELHNNVSHGIPLIPLRYDVTINVDISRNIFFGECNIIIKINCQAKTITVPNLEIFAIIKINLIDNHDNKTINIQKFSFINKTCIELDFTESLVDFLSPGTYILKMIYVRNILDDEDFFESFNINKEKVFNNKGIKIINARELFPCWDEPIFKSIFNISILHHKNYKFLSSMSIREQVEDVNNMLWTHFDESPLMSAQHLITVVTTFVCFCTENVEFWYKRETADQVQYANDVVKKVVYYLEKKNIKKRPKIDYFVIKDFQHSNVKPLGFILLREEDIIYNNTIDHNARKMEIANVITYETISYWYNDVSLWSKEGFITFFTAYTLNQTELHSMDLFIVQTQQESLRFETLPADSHPLYTANVSAVRSFQPSFYCIKSSIIWRMLYNLISDNVFWTGIRTYIMQYNQSNVVQINQLWNDIQIVLNKKGDHHLNIAVIMNNWITEKNYFQLFVKREYLYNVTIFLPVRSKLDEIPTSLTLVTYTTKSNDDNSFLFNWKKSFHVNKTFDKNDWIIVNLQQVGYYRVNYDLDNWRNLALHLFFYNSIHVLNRAQIIDDAFYFLLQRHLSFNLFWNITSFLFYDTDYVAWYPMIKAVEYMTCIWPVQDNNNIKIKIMEVFFNLVKNIGYYDRETESDFTQYLREEAVKWLCVLGDPECRKLATYELQEDLDSSVQDKPLKLKEWIYCKGLMSAKQSTWWMVWNKWENTSDNTLLEYLTCSTDVKIILNYFFTITALHLRSQWRNSVNILLLIVAKHAKNQKVLEVIFNYLKLIEKPVYRVVILIVIITHEHDVIQFKKIIELVQTTGLSDNWFIQISEERLIDAIKKKIIKRIKEYNRQVRMYESLNVN